MQAVEPCSKSRTFWQETHAAIRLGRFPRSREAHRWDSRHRCGRLLRRLVAGTIAQQVSEDFEKATKPFQFALRTRAGCECVSHVLQTVVEMDENTTLLSVDGVGTFDLISRLGCTARQYRLRTSLAGCPPHDLSATEEQTQTSPWPAHSRKPPFQRRTVHPPLRPERPVGRDPFHQ